LTKIHDWATKWLVTFDVQKTETMTISRKINKPNHPPLYMDNKDISTVSEHKHLYSNRGLTNVKYIFSRVFRSNINLNFLKILILLLAFPVIMSMCFSKLPLFISDIVTDIQSTIKLFADDTSLYLIVDDPNETADSLNNDLTKIHDWVTK
jgi:hypothetical protein